VQGTVNTVRQQIVAKAMQSLDTDTLAGYCEQFVEETVEAITGRRGATGQRETTAAAALQHALGQGLGVTQAQAQPGDLVYYGNAAGGTGHVAIYMGNGQQISTEDVGGAKVHIEGILPGAQFVRVPGLPDSAAAPSIPPSGTNRAPDGRFGVNPAGTVNLADPTTDAARSAAARTRAELEAAKVAAFDARTATAQFAQTLAGIDPKNIGAAVSKFQEMQSIFERLETAKLPDNADAVQKQTALNTAYAKTLDFVGLWARGIQSIAANTGDLAAIQRQIGDAVGGPLAANLNRQLDLMNDQARIADRIGQLTQRKADLQDQQQETATARQDADRARQYRQMMQSFADADADYARQQARARETTAFTGTSRGFEDRTRQLQFSQQIQGTDLQNALVDLQQRQQNQVYNRTAQEQAVAGDVKIAGTREQAAAFAASLTMMHERDLKQKDADTKAIDDIQARIRLQQRSAAVDSYNLETERIQSTRAHEDRLAGLDAEDRAIARQRQLRDRADQAAQFNLEGERQAEDRRATAALKAIDDEIAGQQRLAEATKTQLDGVQALLGLTQQLGVAIAGVSGTAQSQLQGQSLAQFPTTGAIRRLGGMAAGGTLLPGEGAIVGDAPGGGITPYTERVTNRGGIVTITPLANRPAAQGGAPTINLNLGDVSLMLSEQDKAEIRAFVAAKIDRARTSGRAFGKSIGRG
jgi:hypothetical protein